MEFSLFTKKSTQRPACVDTLRPNSSRQFSSSHFPSCPLQSGSPWDLGLLCHHMAANTAPWGDDSALPPFVPRALDQETHLSAVSPSAGPGGQAMLWSCHPISCPLASASLLLHHTGTKAVPPAHGLWPGVLLMANTGFSQHTSTKASS